MMAIHFKLLGNGTSTSSVDITDIDFTNVYPAIPEPARVVDRNIVHETPAGFPHMFTLGEPRRQWDIALRLLTAIQWRQLLTVFRQLDGSNWCTWSADLGGTADATSTTSYLDDAAVTFTFVDQWRDWCIISLGGATGPPAGEIRRIASTSDLSPGTRFNVTKAWSTAPTTDTTFTIGFPVRFLDDIRCTSTSNALFDAEFTFEEVILDGTE